MHPSEPTLNDYVDQTLGRDERAEVMHHLDTCSACRQLVEELREIARGAAALGPVTPPAQIWTRIEKELRTGARGAEPGEAGSRAGSLTWTWLAAAAVLLLAVFVGVRFGPSASLPAPDTTAEAIETELALTEEHYRKA